MKKCNLFDECIEDKSLVAVKNGYPILDCQSCQRRFSVIRDSETHLSEVYSDKYFFEGGDGYPDYLEGKDILYYYGAYYAKKLKKYALPGKVLDVGCAAGFILKGFESMGWKGQGIEPNETMAAYGRKELNLDIYNGSIEDFSSEQKFNLVCLIQVIGHFYNVDKSMENISSLLLPGGLVLVESWNMNSWIARILGKHWHEYSPPSVINWFSDKSLKKLFDDYGFEPITSGHPVKKIQVKHALSLLKEKSPAFYKKNSFFRFIEKKLGVMAMIYPPVDLKWYLFRKKE